MKNELKMLVKTDDIQSAIIGGYMLFCIIFACICAIIANFVA